jgi:thiamine biosynthesis lipoprotein
MPARAHCRNGKCVLVRPRRGRIDSSLPRGSPLRCDPRLLLWQASGLLEISRPNSKASLRLAVVASSVPWNCPGTSGRPNFVRELVPGMPIMQFGGKTNSKPTSGATANSKSGIFPCADRLTAGRACLTSHQPMNRRHFLFLTLGAGSGVGWSGTLPHSFRRVERKSTALGAEVSIVAYHWDREAAERGLSAAFQVLDDIENVLSLYRPQSQLCQLNRDGMINRPHPLLVKVLSRALEWSRRTDGAFDPTVQPLWNYYNEGGRPDSDQLQAARQFVAWRQVQVEAQRIRLGPGQAITLNGIAQGFAADRVRDVLRSYGIRYALANTGEFAALRHKPEGKDWQIGIQHPRVPEAYIALAALDDRFLATSGDYETKFSEDFSNHHIFDPATGRSPTTLSSATVIAPTGLEADALSTAIFVLGPDRGLKLASARRGVEVLMVLKNGEVVSTPNFPRIA